MPFTFQRENYLLLDPRGHILDTNAYSGHGDGLNNPAMQAVRGEGPIPAGAWHIGAPRVPVDHLGPLAMPLTPLAGTSAMGWTALFVHGDNEHLDYSGSDGCLVVCRAAREMMASSDDRTLIVE